MRLKDKNGPIPGGLWYEYSDDRGNKYRVNGFSVTFGNSFNTKVASNMTENGVSVPDDLAYRIEQQICARVPSSMVWQEAGDKVATVIHSFASTGDKVAKALGFDTQLKKKAADCPKCKKRRDRLNQAIG